MLARKLRSPSASTRTAGQRTATRGGARGRNGGIREELAAGVKGVDRPADGSIQNGVGFLWSYKWLKVSHLQ